ncbi:MAG TPA: hypothetical protein VEZ71_08605 [Archangium sp.]|nr:hypothetical protein [Archangium sp.]
MTDACSLSPQLPALKLRIEGQHVDPGEGGTLREESGWGRHLSHHALEGYLQTKAVWTTLPSEI